MWSDLAPVMFLGDPSATGEIDGITQKLVPSLPSRAIVLDIPCGLGRHAREWARRGHTVTAVDRTRLYVDEARNRAAADQLQVEWVVEDMRTFRRPQAFDLISCLSSFGYFDDERDDLAFLTRCRENLAPLGHLVLEFKGKEVAERQPHRKHWWQVGDVLVLQEQRSIDDGRRVELHWIVVRADGSRGDYAMHLRLYDAEAITALLHRAGFTHVQLFGTLTGMPYDQRAGALVAVAS